MSKNGNRMVTCARCENVKRHHARGCCKCCYNKIMERGLQALYPVGGALPAASSDPERDEFYLRFGRSLGRPGLHSWRQGGITQ